MDQEMPIEPPSEAAELFIARQRHGLLLGEFAQGKATDVDTAVRTAFEGPWRRSSPCERQLLLHRAHDALDRNWEELARIETADMGAPISRARASKATSLRIILFFASMRIAQDEIFGPVLTLIPFDA